MGISGRLANFFLKSQLTPLLALVLVLLGLFAILVTPREEEPQINVTMANVFIAYPGASAQEVERVVAIPAEQVLSQITGVEHVYSASYAGQAVLTVQFKVGESHIESLVKLHDVVQANRDWLPANLGVLPPLIKAKGIDDVPIVSLALWREDPLADRLALTQVAHALELELKRVPGTREVYTLGATPNSVRVLLSPEKLNAYQLTVPELTARLQASNISQQAGTLLQNNQEIWLQTGDFLSSADDVAHLMIAVTNGKPVYLSDVADIVQGADLPNSYVWFGTGPAVKDKQITQQGEFNAVTLAISKKSGANAVDIAEQLLARVDSLRGTVIPDDVQITVTRNYGETANDKAKKLIGKLLFATVAVIALVWLTMGRREAFVVGAAVLLTLAATLFASWAWGFTLNRVSLFALIFSIGILVDDAIVVVENIHRHRSLDPNKPLAELIPLAVDEVGGPTILATFTVIAALLPMAFVSGLMGPYMSPIPINASMGMVISLLIAFIVTPWLVLHFTGTNHPAAGVKHRNYFERILTPFLREKAGKPARSILWIGIVLLVMAAMSLGVFKLVILKMLPFDNKSEFQVVIDMPTGTPLEQTQAAVRALTQHIATVPEVTDYQAYVGAASPINFNSLVRQYYLRSFPEQADIQVNLQGKHERDRSSHEIASSVIPELDKIAKQWGAKVKVVEVPPGPPVMSPIVAEIYGPDYQAMRDMAGKVKQQFSETKGIVAIDDTVTETAAKWQLSILQHKAMLLGVEPSQISQLIQTTLSGRSVTSLHESGAKYAPPVKLVLADEARNQLEPILQLKLRSQSGALVPLSELVTVREVGRDYPIYHKDLLPVVYVFGDMNGELDSPLYGMFSIQSSLPDESELARYYVKQPEDIYRGFSLKWDGEWQITYETFRDMGIAYGVGLILIYLLVVAQFRSYLVPLIIMAPIPLTIIGVMPGHALLGAQYTATSMIGMIALAGIIVRNSILLVDFVNLQLAQGVPLQEAVINAANARAKPILLTGLAAMLGALFILDDPIFNGLAISLIFGIMISTLLTLIVIPVLYYASLYKQKGSL